MDTATLEDLDAIGAECRRAVETILESLECVRAEIVALRADAPAAAAALERAATKGFQACGFQDIVGQRLDRIRYGRNADPLLAGPGAPLALDQAAIDSLFS